MKIAIQGHPTRGKEVIQIFKDLGTEDLMDHTGSHIDWVYLRDDSVRPNQLIVGTDVAFLKGYNYKVYTLEEFEKEFPFKVGDIVLLKGTNNSFKIIALELFVNKLCYKLDNGLHYSPNKLTIYKEMKEERNIVLTLNKAKEWYNKGGELREIALQAFTEDELSPLPKSWEEYCKRYKVPTMMLRINIPNKYVALWKLEQLRDCYRQGWKPDWNNSVESKYCIAIEYSVLSIRDHGFLNVFLSFQSIEITKEFLKNFEPLIKEAGDLI